MEELNRKIRVFFAGSGWPLFQLILIIAILVLGIRTVRKLFIGDNTQQGNYIEYEEVIIQEKTEAEEENEEYISRFIDYCNEGKIEEAYNMLSEECKETYSNIDVFNKEYIKKNFNIYIVKYEIQKQNKIYIVSLTQDVLSTGKIDSKKELKYKIQGVLEKEIFICN